MKSFLLAPAFLALISLPPSPVQTEPPGSPPPRPIAPAIESALHRLNVPPKPWVLLPTNMSLPMRREGWYFEHLPGVLYKGRATEIDALVKTQDPVDDRLLQIAARIGALVKPQEPEDSRLPIMDKGESLDERYRVVYILIHRRNEKVVPVLEKMMASDSAKERYLAWHAYNDAISDRHLQAPLSFDAVIANCKNEKNEYVRAKIIDFLGACRAQPAVPLLTATLTDDPKSASNALSALLLIHDPDTFPAIIAYCKKVENCWALGEIGTPEAVDYLIERLDETNGHGATWALFHTGSPKALPAIEKCLARLKAQEKPDESDLAAAQVCVLRLKHTDPSEHLLALLEDRKQSNSMRECAVSALCNYDKKSIAERVLKLYRAENDDSTRKSFIYFLGDLPGDDITEAMIAQALADRLEPYYSSHDNLRAALNRRLNTSFREMESLVQYLQREHGERDK